MKDVKKQYSTLLKKLDPKSNSSYQEVHQLLAELCAKETLTHLLYEDDVTDLFESVLKYKRLSQNILDLLISSHHFKKQWCSLNTKKILASDATMLWVFKQVLESDTIAHTINHRALGEHLFDSLDINKMKIIYDLVPDFNHPVFEGGNTVYTVMGHKILNHFMAIIQQSIEKFTKKIRPFFDYCLKRGGQPEKDEQYGFMLWNFQQWSCNTGSDEAIKWAFSLHYDINNFDFDLLQKVIPDFCVKGLQSPTDWSKLLKSYDDFNQIQSDGNTDALKDLFEF